VASPPSACDGLRDKTIGITRDDYGECAGEILAALDSIEPSLTRFVRSGDEEAGSRVEVHYRRLRTLMREVGFTADAWREGREGAGRTVMRWPAGSMRAFNGAVLNAGVQYASALRYPDAGNVEEGRRHHFLARQLHARFR
jgi:hypothetical protein